MPEDTPITDAPTPEVETPTGPTLDELKAQLDAERAKTLKAVDAEKKLRERLKTLEGTAKEHQTEAERLRALEEEKAALEGRVSASDQRVIRSEAKAEALRQGVKADRVQHALRLADFSGVELNEDGDPDPKAIRAAIKAVLDDLPELKGAATVSGGSNPGPNAVKTNPHQNMNDAIRSMAGRR